MKKILASILTLALLVGILPATLAAGSTAAAAPKTVKLLAIGEDFTRSAFDYLYEVFQAEGYEDITLGYVYNELYTPADYNKVFETNSNASNYCRNTRGYWESTAAEFTLPATIRDRDWDYIVFQTNPIQAGQAGTYVEALNTLISTVKRYSTNPDVKIGWHINWPYQQRVTTPEFKEWVNVARLGWDPSKRTYQNGVDVDSFISVYNGDPQTMWEAIAKATQADILNNSKIDFLVPMGAAVMNVQSSFIKDIQRDVDDLEVDGANLTELGKLVAAYTWYSAVTGTKVSEMQLKDAILVETSSAQRKAILEAIDHAIKDPLKVTESSYKTEPVQYKVTVNGKTRLYLPGDTVTATTPAMGNGGYSFKKWNVVTGGVKLDDAAALTTTFTVPARDVELQADYGMPEVQLQVGFGRGDITPTESVPLAGYGGTLQRMSTGTRTPEDRLTITCISVSDGTNTNLIMTQDTLRTPAEWLEKAQKAVEEKLGIPASRVTISATHTHAGPDTGGVEQGDAQRYVLETDSPYFAFWMDVMLKAAEESLADLSPVEWMGTGGHRIPGMNFIRHWRYSDGTMNGVNFQNSGGAVMGFPRDTDQELQVIRFVREGKKDVVMVNWGGHPLYASGGKSKPTYTKISADAPGVLCRYLEKQDEDCLASYFTGALGNVQTECNMNSVRNKWKNPFKMFETDAWLDAMEAYGNKMGDYVLAAMENLDVVRPGAVRSVRQQHPVVGRDYKKIITVEQDAITIGDSIAFVGAGYEIFDQSCIDVKNASPYETTFVLAVTQWHEYMPTWETLKYTLIPGGQDAYEAKPVQFNEVPGTAEDLTDGMIGLLNLLYEGAE